MSRENKLVIQMSGAPGAGKSTLARLLRPVVGAVIIDHDVIRSSLLTSGMPFDTVAKQAYLLQWAQVEDFLKQGLSVIIDSICNYQEVIDQGSTLASRYDCTYWYVECKARDVDMLDRRLRERNPMASQRTAVDCPPLSARATRANENADALFTKWTESPSRPQDNVIVVDATEDPAILRDKVLERLGRT